MNAISPPPQASDLINRALVDTDLVFDIGQVMNGRISWPVWRLSEYRRLASAALTAALEMWCEDTCQSASNIPSDLWDALVDRAVAEARAEVERQEQISADELAEGIEHGDLDASGNSVPYDSYFGGL